MFFIALSTFLIVFLIISIVFKKNLPFLQQTNYLIIAETYINYQTIIIIFTWSDKGNVLNNKRPNTVQPEGRYNIVQALNYQTRKCTGWNNEKQLPLQYFVNGPSSYKLLLAYKSTR